MEISGLGFQHEIHGSGHIPDPGKITGHIIERLDQDGDGHLNVNELGDRAGRMQEADANEDGLLSQDELIQQFETKMAEVGGFQTGQMPDIHRLKSMIGEQYALRGGDGQPDLFSILDDLDATDEDKKDIQRVIENAPFEIIA